jgi:hypothetical protein
MNTMMKQRKNRVQRLLERAEMKDAKEREMLKKYLLKTKKGICTALDILLSDTTQIYFQSLLSKRRCIGR